MRKKTFFLLLILLAANFSDAQFYRSILPSPEFTNALEKIVLDFRLNFKTIQGENLATEGEVDTYRSTVKLPGASECLIYKYHSVEDTTASWQGFMYRGDDFKEASKVYTNIFRLVKKSQIRWIDKSAVGFSGELEEPKEELRFTVSTLNFDLNDPRYKRFEAEVEMVTTNDGWEVHLNLQTKKSDTEGTKNY